MKILQVSAYDIQGGAGKAAFRLHESLIDRDLDSTMLVQLKHSDLTSIHNRGSKLSKFTALIKPPLDKLYTNRYKDKSKTLFSCSRLPFTNISNWINSYSPDIVHLHWVNSGMLNIKDISRINAPIVWSFHDMWPFTGGCHYDEECGRFVEKCGQCKVLASQRDIDLSSSNWEKKYSIWASKKEMVGIGLSSWIADQARKSSIFKNHIINHIPNLIDTAVYCPIDKAQAKSILGLSPQKKLVLFGAVNALDDPRKGFPLLTQALSQLDQHKIEFLVFGASESNTRYDHSNKVNYIGKLSDDISLKLIYNAADVTVLPSIQENLSNVVLESLACGTPVTAFNIGGNSDLIEHCINGYLADPFSSEDLSSGIQWVLNHPNYMSLSKSSREKVLNEFSPNVVLPKYINLYEELLSGQFW